MKVLLVTTDARVEADVRSALLGDDVTVAQVATPQRALLLVQEDPAAFDAVVADGDAAPTGGFAFAHQLKQRVDMGEAMPPVVLLIARDDDRWLAKWSRADVYVRKPVDPFDLDQVLRAVVSGSEIPTRPMMQPAPESFDAILSASRVIGDSAATAS